jgi:hypothetical protein
MIWLLIGYLYLFIHRPFEIWPAIGDLRIELIYMLVTGAAWLLWPGKRLTANPSHLAVAAFGGAVLLCGVVSPWWDTCYTLLDGYWRILVFYLLIVTVVQSDRELRLIIVAYLAVMSLYMLHSAYEFQCGRYISRMGISRMVGVGTSYCDPNAFASTCLLSMVFVPAVWKMFADNRFVRYALLCFLLLGSYCILRTGSRGAFVGLVIWIGLAVAASRHRWSLAAAMIVLMPVAWFLLPPSLQNRFETIIDPSVGPKNAQYSTQGRIEGLMVGFELWGKNPLTGIGPGAWRVATGRDLESHNLYGQMVGETGTLGLLGFLGILGAYVLNLRAIRRQYAAHPHWVRDLPFSLTGSIGFAVFLLLLEGNFGHNLFRYNWPWFAAFLAAARECVDRRAREEAQAAFDGPSEPSTEDATETEEPEEAYAYFGEEPA